MNPAILMLIMRVLLALLLYTFLALLLVFLWRDMRRSRLPGESLPDAHLLVEAGPEPGQAFLLGSDNVIGRSAENDVSLPDDTVSARHARISFSQGRWWIEDLASKNGTLLNQSVVKQPAAISSGDRIEVGQVHLIFKSGPPESP